MANIQTKISSMIVGAIKVARPIHWVKNLSVFAALIFSGNLYDKHLFMLVFASFWVFSFAASTTYIFNDIMDVKKDRLHPIKRNRPIANGSLPVTVAFIECLVLFIISIILANSISGALFLLIIIYLFLQLAYSSFLKNVPIIDILIIATGFVIRVYAGAFVINAHLSIWFLLCVISAALFLASGKRRAELGVMGDSGKTREALAHYPKDLLNSYVTMFANSAWLSWALFTFYESPRIPTPIWILLSDVSKTASINKLLMLTIPVTIFAIMRYQSLIFEGRSEAPEKVLLTDKALVVSVGLWILMVVWTLYGGVTVAY